MTLIPDIRDEYPWRYVPDTMMTWRGLSPVTSCEFLPDSARTNADHCIRRGLGVLLVHCANGETRTMGFPEARINSELRMTVRLADFHFRDEIIRKWEVCETL